MDFMQLKYFITVCKYNHMTQAADQLFISQSALSRHINQLESEIGVHLFDRAGRNLHLTTAGQDFLAFARSVVAQHEEVLGQIQDYLSRDGHALALAVVPASVQYGLHRPVLSFRREHPGVRLDVREAGGEEALRLLDEEAVELAIVRPYLLPNDSYKEIQLAEDQLVLVMPPGHALAARPAVSLEAAAGEKFLLPDGGEAALPVSACRRAGFEPQVFARFARMETVLGFVAEGAGVALLMERELSAFALQGVVVRPLAVPVASPLSLVFPHGRRLSAGAILFQKYLLSYLARPSGKPSTQAKSSGRS